MKWPLLLRAEVAEACGEHAVATKYLARYIEISPTEKSGYLTVARAHSRLGNTAKALECYCHAADQTKPAGGGTLIEMARYLVFNVPTNEFGTQTGLRAISILLSEPIENKGDHLSLLRVFPEIYRANRPKLSTIFSTIADLWLDLPINHDDMAVRVNAASIGLRNLGPNEIAAEATWFIKNANWNTFLIYFMKKVDIGCRLANCSKITQFFLNNLEYYLTTSEIDWDTKIGLQQVVICNSYADFEKSLKYFGSRKQEPNIQIRPAKNICASEPLRIALLVSGQLRGYREAYQSWKHLGIQDHNVSIYVHSWINTGGKEPVPAHANRLFSGAVLDAYVEACHSSGYDTVRSKYPSLFKMLDQSKCTTADEVKSVYAKSKVILEDDTKEEFSHFLNPMKMYYKIEECFKHCADKAEEFDLFVRLRPDRAINNRTNIDWHQILRACIEENIVFVEDAYHNHFGQFNIGDQIAVGTYEAMRHYSFTFSKTTNLQTLVGKLAPKFGRDLYYGHRNLALSMFEAQIELRRLTGLHLGDYMDVKPPSNSEILSRVQQDIKDREPFKHDTSLLRALNMDLH